MKYFTTYVLYRSRNRFPFLKISWTNFGRWRSCLSRVTSTIISRTISGWTCFLTSQVTNCSLIKFPKEHTIGILGFETYAWRMGGTDEPTGLWANWTLFSKNVVCNNMGQNRPLFVYLCPFPNTMTNRVHCLTIKGKRVDGVLGIWTRNCWKIGRLK